MLFLFNFKASTNDSIVISTPQTIIKSMSSFLQERTNIIDEHDREMRRIKAEYEKNQLQLPKK